MKNSRLVLTIAAVMALSILVAGCGGKEPKTLEEYVEANQGEKDSIAGIVSDDPNATVTISENTMDITYTVEDESFTKEVLDTALNSLGDQFSTIIQNLETKTGIEGINIQVTYMDAKGAEITSKQFE